MICRLREIWIFFYLFFEIEKCFRVSIIQKQPAYFKRFFIMNFFSLDLHLVGYRTFLCQFNYFENFRYNRIKINQDRLWSWLNFVLLEIILPEGFRSVCKKFYGVYGEKYFVETQKNF